MPPPRLELHPGADEDLTHAAEVYAAADVEIARSFLSELLRVRGLILEAPQRWMKHAEGIHRKRLRRFPFVVIYRIKDDTVQVLAVAHTSRPPSYWKDRLEDK
jgi:plasmid stabilization system protein ParE